MGELPVIAIVRVAAATYEIVATGNGRVRSPAVDLPWHDEVCRDIVEDGPREGNAKDFLVVFVERNGFRVRADEIRRLFVVVVVDRTALTDAVNE